VTENKNDYKNGQHIQFTATIGYQGTWAPVTEEYIRRLNLREYVLEGEVHIFESKTSTVAKDESDILYLTEPPAGFPRRTTASCYVPNKYFTPVSVKKDRFESVLEGL